MECTDTACHMFVYDNEERKRKKGKKKSEPKNTQENLYLYMYKKKKHLPDVKYLFTSMCLH